MAGSESIAQPEVEALLGRKSIQQEYGSRKTRVRQKRCVTLKMRKCVNNVTSWLVESSDSQIDDGRRNVQY